MPIGIPMQSMGMPVHAHGRCIVEPSGQVQRIAMYSKRNLKRINNPDDIMALPYSIVGTRQRYNIYAGNY